MPDPLSLVIVVILIALVFDFGNGLNDAANAVATVVATGTLSLKAAVLLSAVMNFAGAFLFSVAVATTIAKGIVHPEVVTIYIVLGGLIGAIAWTYGATHFGIPISVSHALIGGFAGSGIIGAGFSAINSAGLFKVAAFIFIAPLVGLFGGSMFMVLVFWIFRKVPPNRTKGLFRKMQLVSASIYSLGHGTNDAQKTIGIISILLFSAGYLGSELYIPWWVIILSYGTIAAGTLVGGWKVIKTMGTKITKLQPVDGFCAETSGATVILGCSYFGIPVSTTHVIAGSIMGVGSVKRTSAVRWTVARNIAWAWVITIPAAGAMGALSYGVISLFI
ncbi:MAG: inorganic phosphate transporter [bacterium]|nr:inorganic phosphate transporter [bacterium]